MEHKNEKTAPGELGAVLTERQRMLLNSSFTNDDLCSEVVIEGECCCSESAEADCR